MSHQEPAGHWVPTEHRSTHRAKAPRPTHKWPGLDVAIEIHVHGSRAKDVGRNVAWFARLGIPEYFAYEVEAQRLAGWRLPSPGATVYQRIVPQHGSFPSLVLGLDLMVSGDRLRFLAGDAVLPDPRELVERLEELVDRATERAEAAARQAADEQRRAEEEARRAEEETRRAEEETRRAEEEKRRAEDLAREVEVLRALEREDGEG